jgi:TolA-binding protein
MPISALLVAAPHRDAMGFARRLKPGATLRAALFLSLPVVAMLAGQAQAFMPDDHARQAINQLRLDTEARFQKLESGSRAQLELANEMEQLRSELARLRGQVEMLTHELETDKKRQRDFYSDLDTRLQRLEPSALSQAGSTGSPSDPSGAPPLAGGGLCARYRGRIPRV